ncbi:MAG: hypothetical protein HYY04_15255 [Chloroflexi bacterium]|nr:hypothetical protein [Chloroflexota bacterium]
MDRRSETLARLRPAIERARTFSGWDLSAVRVRPLGPGPPWDYDALAREQVRRAHAVLDMGTGGGERLAQIVGGLDLLDTRVVQQGNIAGDWRRRRP